MHQDDSFLTIISTGDIFAARRNKRYDCRPGEIFQGRCDIFRVVAFDHVYRCVVQLGNVLDGKQIP